MKYKVIKPLNHNVIQALNEESLDCIIFGKGIGFNINTYEFVDSSKIEKVYFIQNKKNLSLYEKLVSICDERLVTIVENVIEKIEQATKIEPNENLRIALLDHINFSIYRFNHGLDITNMFIDELKMMYKQESRIAKNLLDEINNVFQINLPEAEIGFITLHIHTALKKDSISKTNLYLQIINNTLKYLETTHKIQYDQNSIEKIRFITHLKFALKRTEENSLLKKDITNSIQRDFPNAYKIAKDTANFIYEEFSICFAESEVAYLALHLQLISTDSTEKI